MPIGFRGTLRDRKYDSGGITGPDTQDDPTVAQPTEPTDPNKVVEIISGPQTVAPRQEERPQLRGIPAEPPIEAPPGDVGGGELPPPPLPPSRPISPENSSISGTFASPQNPAALSVFRTPNFGVNRATIGGSTAFGPGSSPLTGTTGGAGNEYEELLKKLRGGR